MTEIKLNENQKHLLQFVGSNKPNSPFQTKMSHFDWSGKQMLKRLEAKKLVTIEGDIVRITDLGLDVLGEAEPKAEPKRMTESTPAEAGIAASRNEYFRADLEAQLETVTDQINNLLDYGSDNAATHEELNNLEHRQKELTDQINHFDANEDQPDTALAIGDVLVRTPLSGGSEGQYMVEEVGKDSLIALRSLSGELLIHGKEYLALTLSKPHTGWRKATADEAWTFQRARIAQINAEIENKKALLYTINNRMRGN